MILVLIVGDYSTFVSKASVRKIDETNVAAFKTIHSWPTEYISIVRLNNYLAIFCLVYSAIIVMNIHVNHIIV